MADRWNTKVVPLEGGLLQNADSLVQGTQKPGSAIIATNYEPSVLGGYRRVSGFAKFDTNAVPGTGSVLGVFVFNNGVVAAQNGNFYFSSGSGWGVKFNTDLTRTTPARVRGTKYHWTKGTLVMVDGVNSPARYQDDGTYTVLSTAPAAQAYVAEHKQHLFTAAGQVVSFSAPNDETNWTAGAGAGAINVGFNITGLKEWRGNLYVFGTRNIAQITGSSLTDFAVVPVTDDLGCLSGDTIWEVGGDLMYLGNDGLRTLGGTNRIGDFELATVSKEIQKLLTDLQTTYDAAGAVTAVIVRGKSQYRIFFNLSSTTESLAPGVLAGLRQPQNTMQVPFFQDQLNWEFFQLQGIKPFCCDSDYVNAVEKVVHGGYDGFVYAQETGPSFNGANVFAQLQSPFMPLDDAELRKTIYKGTAYLNIEGNLNLSVQASFDFNDPNTPTPPPVIITNSAGTIAVYDGVGVEYDIGLQYDQQPTPQVHFALVGSGKTVSFGWQSNDTNPPYTLRAFQFQYGLGGRR